MQRHWRWHQVSSYNYKLYIRFLSTWPNEAKNSCVFRLLISVIIWGSTAPLDAPAAGLPRMLNAARSGETGSCR